MNTKNLTSKSKNSKTWGKCNITKQNCKNKKKKL